MVDRFSALVGAHLSRWWLVACLALLAPAGARADVPVWFLQGDQLVSVQRPGASAADSLQALVAGPSRAERRRGLRSAIPRGVSQRGYDVAGKRVVIDVPAAFFGQTAGTPAARARLTQLVKTVVGLPGSRTSPWIIERVQLLVDGAAVAGIVPGIDTSVPVTATDLAPPAPAPAAPAPADPGAPNPWLISLQARLAALTYLDPADIDGYGGPVTEAAIMAFQKWEGLPRDGMAGPQTAARLAAAKRPVPRSKGGRAARIEVLLDRQLVLAIKNNRVIRTVHAATGATGSPTPTGTYHVDAKIRRWWSIPFGEWLPWSVRFAPGFALHAYAAVPPVPSSHGCVRMISRNAIWIYGFARRGTVVRVM